MNTHSDLKMMLEKYCEWLNLWMDEDRHLSDYNPPRYTVEMFADSADGFARITAIVPARNSVLYGHLLIAEVYDGDDGGPTDLLGWFDDEHKLYHLSQGFDVSIHFILREGVFENTP